MKLQPILIGIAAGIAAALLFLAPIGATLIAFPLFLLTGLPIAIAALGWGLVGGAAATLTASVVIGVVLPILPPVVIFLVVFGIPIVWLARLAGMWRETDAADPASPREWYPLGRILLHAAIAAAIGLTAIGFFFGYDPGAIGGAAQEALTLALADLQPGQPPPTPETVRAFVELYVAILPATLALMIVLAMVVNLYLGSRIARASGRMQRPPEHMWMVELPGVATIVFGIALVVAFLPGTIGQVGGIVAGAFGAALVLVGLAVAHAITFGIAGRGALLGLLYVLIVISGLPLILVALAGIGESVLRLRARRFAGRGVPPT